MQINSWQGIKEVRASVWSVCMAKSVQFVLNQCLRHSLRLYLGACVCVFSIYLFSFIHLVSTLSGDFNKENQADRFSFSI